MEDTSRIDKFRRWLAHARSGGRTLKCVFDFDGTLVPCLANDSARIPHATRHAEPLLRAELAAPSCLGGICSARAPHEVRRIIEGVLTSPGAAAGGFSIAENGGCLIAPQLVQQEIDSLTEAGFKLLRDGEFSPGYSVVSLAKRTPEWLAEEIVMPALEEEHSLAGDEWALSVTASRDAHELTRLRVLCAHETLEETRQSVWRVGSAFLKIRDTADGRAKKVVAKIQRRAESRRVYALVTPPFAGCPVWGVDLGAGVTKAEALEAMCRAYRVLSEGPDEHLSIAYFGDGDNDLAAFEFLARRPGPNWSFLVDRPDGNQSLLRSAPRGTIFLEGRYDLDGVRAAFDRLRSELRTFR